MKKKISAILSCALCFTCVNAVMAEDINQQQAEKARGQVVHFTEAVDPDLVVLPGLEQDAVQYKELPEEQEKTAVIPGTSSFDVDNVSTKQVPEGEPDIAVQPPQARQVL